MAFVAATAAVRRGLVGLLLLALVSPALAQSVPAAGAAAENGGGAGAEAAAMLEGVAEVLGSRCSRLHENPLNLLFLLPGAVFLLSAATLRRRKGLLTVVLLAAAGVAFLGIGAAHAVGEPPEAAAESLVREAESSYRAGRPGEALELYRQASELLPCNPALEHNLGVCSAAVGDIGAAVVHLRRSLRSRPADPDTREALRAVQEAAGLEGQLPPPVPLNPDVLFVATLALANLSLGAAGFALRRKGVRALILMILLAIAGSITLGVFLGLLYDESRPVGVIVAEDVELARIPEDDARASVLLPPGTSLRVRGRAGGYYLVETASRFRGWVREGAILLD
jgi:tetratricopeptide (TPR) repeat protein